MGIGENAVIQHLGRWAGSLTIDTGSVTDGQLEMRILENSRLLAGSVEAGGRSALQPSTPRVAELGEAPGGPADGWVRCRAQLRAEAFLPPGAGTAPPDTWP